MHTWKQRIARVPLVLDVWHCLRTIVKPMGQWLSQERIQRHFRFLQANRTCPLKVCFCVIYDSVFPLERVFTLMFEDSAFDAYILVIPDMSRGCENMDECMRRTFQNLRAKYGDRVLSSFEDGQFICPIGLFDCFAMMNPYSRMTHKYYTIPYLALHGSIVFMTRYFTETGTVYSNTFNALPELSYLWRFFAENDEDARRVKEKQPMLARFGGVIPIGLPKADFFARTDVCARERKRIIIAPHHSMDPIGACKFTISCFPRYADFFLRLPELYPNIDWVFRPHPLTMVTMVKSGRWTAQQKDEYESTLRGYDNVEFQNGGSYYSTFMNSDALIQDCSSFLPEYFYSGKPQCYLLAGHHTEAEQFQAYGRELLSYTYKAFNESDILNFIENVVVAGNDVMKGKREKFASQRLMYNYPHASEAMIDYLKKAFRRA